MAFKNRLGKDSIKHQFFGTNLMQDTLRKHFLEPASFAFITISGRRSQAEQ